MKIEKKPSLADVISDVPVRKIKSVFFSQMNTLIDWRIISNLINKHYLKVQSVTGSRVTTGFYCSK